MAKRIKPQSNSKIAALTPEQRERLDVMLFEKNLSYRGVASKSLPEFGVYIHPRSLARYYQKTAPKRTMSRIISGRKTANEILKAFTDNPEDTYRAILGMVGQVAFEKAVEAKENEEELDVGTIREILTLLISARREDVQSKRYALGREKWEFDVVRMCQQHHAELQAISVDKSLDEDARLLAIQRRLFGTKLPE